MDASKFFIFFIWPFQIVTFYICYYFLETLALTMVLSIIHMDSVSYFGHFSTGCLGPYGAGPFTQAESLGSLKQFEAHRMDCRHGPPFVCLSLSKLKSCLFQNIFFVCLSILKVEKLFISKQLYILVLHMMIINCFYFCFNCMFWPKK